MEINLTLHNIVEYLPEFTEFMNDRELYDTYYRIVRMIGTPVIDDNELKSIVMENLEQLRKEDRYYWQLECEDDDDAEYYLTLIGFFDRVSVNGVQRIFDYGLNYEDIWDYFVTLVSETSLTLCGRHQAFKWLENELIYMSEQEIVDSVCNAFASPEEMNHLFGGDI